MGCPFCFANYNIGFRQSVGTWRAVSVFWTECNYLRQMNIRT